MRSPRKMVMFLTSLLLCAAVFMMPIRTQAEEYYGVVTEYTGDIQFSAANNLVALSNTYIKSYSVESDITETESTGVVENGMVMVTYTGHSDFTVRIQGSVGTYLNGSVYLPVTFTENDAIADGYLTVDLMNTGYDDLTISKSQGDITPSSTTVYIQLSFDNFEVTGTDMYFPISFDITYTCSVNGADSVVTNYKWITQNVGNNDWIGSIAEYSDVRDLPGYYGDSTKLEQEIIDGIADNTEAVNNGTTSIVDKLQKVIDSVDSASSNLQTKLTAEMSSLKTHIQNRFSNLENVITVQFTTLTSNLRTWFSNLTTTITTKFDELMAQDDEQHEETINGFDSSEGTTKNEEFATEVDAYTFAESNLIDSTDDFSYHYFDSFEVSSDHGIFLSFSYVVTWFTNFWQMGGYFTDILTFAFLIYVCSFVLRLRR